ncbi:hypothetical protein GCM10012278_28840 [Nonomuraea glycinis]|uniref:Alpha/beta hydrolase n=1 Tax=Nonomuraea glycinis TaxID=2047744 RepID=A0A918A597_9ACTN|nr:hypothetical protein GCM10012278_28840 [Nonomuraea glycinis]
MSFSAFQQMTDIDTLAPRKDLLVAGADAHSRYYSEDVQAKAPDTVDLVIVPGADHVDLYDRKDLDRYLGLLAPSRRSEKCDLVRHVRHIRPRGTAEQSIATSADQRLGQVTSRWTPSRTTCEGAPARVVIAGSPRPSLSDSCETWDERFLLR